MNTSRVSRLTECVKLIDRDLFCKEEKGKVLLCREATEWDEFEVQGDHFRYSRRVPQFVFALTDDFTQNGNPIDLGIEPLIHRIRAMDLHGDYNFFKDMEIHEEKEGYLKESRRRGQYEDMAREARPVFKKAFEDVNTSGMEKKDKRRTNKWL